MPPFPDVVRKTLRSTWTQGASVVILAGVFLWAGAAKARHQDDFLNAVGNYRLLPPNAAYRLVLVLPWVEIGLAALLLVPVRFLRRASALALLALLLVFTAGLISLWAQGKNVNCGCFGGTGQSHPAWSVLRNLGLIACAVTSWGSNGRRTTAPRVLPDEGLSEA